MDTMMQTLLKAAAEALSPTNSVPWVPEPHQVPPVGDWFGWLLMGGRGSGKTAPCAKYFHDHMMGPPCLPHIPGGHWASIVAPTLGDAVTSCVQGPSGLIKWQNDLKLRQAIGGAEVRYPNGAVAKLFGAHSPDDVERFRAGGNRCFTAETLILTDRGYVRLDQVTTEHKALTRQGYLPIDRAGIVAKDQELLELTLSDGGVIHLTPDHELFLHSGEEVCAKDLKIGAKVMAWTKPNEQESMDAQYLLEKSYTSEGSHTLQTTRGITDDFMSMWLRLRALTFRNSAKCTTRTISRGIIALRTWLFSQSQSIQVFTQRLHGLSASRMSTSALSVATHSLHSERQKSVVGNATTSVANKLKSERGIATSYANFARKSSIAEFAKEQSVGTAQSFVATDQMPVKAEDSPKQKSSRNSCEKKNSVNTVELLPLANVSVVSIAKSNRIEDVYCVRVPGPNELVVASESTIIGSKNCLVWMEELAAWRYMEDAYEQIRYGLRVGPRPHFICSTTPKPRALLKKMMNDPTIVMTGATTDDNPHLDANVKKALYEDYGGTRMGKQELLGQLLEDVPTAHFKQDIIDRNRLKPVDVPDYLDKIAIGVDPALTSKKESNETGIILAASVKNWWGPVGGDPRRTQAPGVSHAFILDDKSMSGTPDQWANEVVALFQRSKAGLVIAEINAGGELVAANLRTVEPNLPIKVRNASKSKGERAQPIGALYEQGRVHHVGTFNKLEEQMTIFNPEDPDPTWSPDRMDAMVWVIDHLLVGNSTIRKSRQTDRRLARRR